MTLTGSVRLSYHEDPRIALKTTPSSSSSSSSSPHQEPNTTTNQDQPLTTPTPPLFTPIWDYEKFPVGPCVRERDRVSQEVQQALLSNTTSGTKYKGGEDLVRGSSFPGISSNSNALHRRYGSRSGGSGSYGGGVGRVSRHGSRHGSCTVSSQSIPSSPTQEGFGHLGGAPESTTISPITTQPTSPTSPAAGGSVNFVPTSPSKFDQIKAQMERVRSIRAPTTTHSIASSSSSSGGREDPSSKVSLMHTATSSSSSSSSSTSPISVDAKNAKKKKGILHRLFHPSMSSKKKQKSKSRFEVETTQPMRDQSQPLAPIPQPPQPEMQEQPRTLRPKLHQLDHRLPSPSGHQQFNHQHHRSTGSSSSPSSSRSSLLNEKDAHTRTISSSHPPRVSTDRLSSNLEKASSSNNNSNPYDPTSIFPSRPPSLSFSDRSPVERAQDQWREEWLGPSGAILTLFRDQPAKFDCPHCGAIKVVSDVQYVPGVMSYLVAFGLLFLTLGALSYLPFRKEHEGTKDCVHWCPTCGKEVARFMRATGTFEWI
ncbi:hypothetical protein BGZ93_010935 [Podila epicladia]|nr:hypothetical protein BGZ93_010935 [Podila epicladia]